MFSEVPDWWTWAGAGVIVLSTVRLVRIQASPAVVRPALPIRPA